MGWGGGSDWEREGEEKRRERRCEEEKGNTVNELCIIVITGFKFILFYHILFHLERGERVQSK